MSCHSPIGAYHYAAYNSAERYQGIALGATIALATDVGMAGVAAKSRTTVYRAVDAAEEAAIRSTGRFSLEGQDIGLKYFAKSAEDAHQYGQWLYKDGYKVFGATVDPTINIQQYWYPHVDIGAYAFPQEVLPYIFPK